MTSDIDALQELISTGLVMFVQNFLIFVGAVIVILTLSWQLSLGVLVIVPPVVIASRWFRRRSNVAYLEVRESIGENLATLQEGLEGVRVVQAFGQRAGMDPALRPDQRAPVRGEPRDRADLGQVLPDRRAQRCAWASR